MHNTPNTMLYKSILVLIFLQTSALCNSAILSTNGRWIVDDASGIRVKLRCASWASHLEPMIAEGLEKKPVNEIAKLIVALGFNCVRFTWPTYMFTRPDYGSRKVSDSFDKLKLTVAKAGFARNNPEFLNMSVVELHEAVVNVMGKNNLMVVLDNHVSRPGWCCGSNDGNGFFGDKFFCPDEWLQGLKAVARKYKGNAAVIGMSLRNELRGPRQNKKDWYKYMQEGSNTVHNENPDFLVIVSGLSFATTLGFLKSAPLAVNFTNKLVYEAHWYTFGIPPARWIAQTNLLCAQMTRDVRNNYFYLTSQNHSFPLFLSEFGIDQRGRNEGQNRYLVCLLATVAETDIEWALWAFQGSYMIRNGVVNLNESYGAVDFQWDGARNTSFLDRLQFIRQMNQDFKSKNPTYYKIFHPLSGQCVHITNEGAILGSCTNASHWDQHHDGGSIKLVGSMRCLGVAGDGAGARVSDDCSSKWKLVSSTGLHLAAQDGQKKYLCLDRNACDSQIVTKKCLCVGDDLADLHNCAHNPQSQWFKLVPSNV